MEWDICKYHVQLCVTPNVSDHVINLQNHVYDLRILHSGKHKEKFSNIKIYGWFSQSWGLHPHFGENGGRKSLGGGGLITISLVVGACLHLFNQFVVVLSLSVVEFIEQLIVGRPEDTDCIPCAVDTHIDQLSVVHCVSSIVELSGNANKLIR